MSLSQNWKVRGRPVKESEMEEFESGWNKTGKWNRGTIRWNVSHFLFVQQILGLISFSNFFAKSYKMQSMVFAVHGNRFFLWLVEEGGILKKTCKRCIYIQIIAHSRPLHQTARRSIMVIIQDAEFMLNTILWLKVYMKVPWKMSSLPKSLFLNFKILTTFDVNCRWRSYIQWAISNAGNYHLPCTSLFYIPLWMLKYDESLVGQLTWPFTRSTPSTRTILGKRLFVEKKKLSKCWNNRIRCFMLDWAIQIWITAKSKAIKHTKNARSLKRIQRTFNFDK